MLTYTAPNSSPLVSRRHRQGRGGLLRTHGQLSAPPSQEFSAAELWRLTWRLGGGAERDRTAGRAFTPFPFCVTRPSAMWVVGSNSV